jgi:hypothetical protein
MARYRKLTGPPTLAQISITLAKSLAVALGWSSVLLAQPREPGDFKAEPGRAILESAPSGESVVLDGRVLPRDSELFSGTGQFKFAIYRRDATGAALQIWTSAQGAVGGVVSEPASAIGVPVRAGRYSVTLGDGGLTPSLPRLLTLAPQPTPYVRVWLRDPDGVFRVVGPDLPLDAVPLAREAALAGDADRLGGRTPDYYLSRSSHHGAVPMVEFNHFFFNKELGVAKSGCQELKVELTVNAPDDGVLVILGHANIAGVVRAGGGHCGSNVRQIQICPPPISQPGVPPGGLQSPPRGVQLPAGGLRSPPDMPSGGVGPAPPPPRPKEPPGGLPSLTPPDIGAPSAKLPPDSPLPDAAGSLGELPPLPCIEGELLDSGFGERTSSKGGRGALYLFRRDIAQVELQTLSKTDIEFDPDVLRGRRMDVSATIAIPPGRIKLEMVGYNASFGGFGEHNLTAIFIPQRR